MTYEELICKLLVDCNANRPMDEKHYLKLCSEMSQDANFHHDLSDIEMILEGQTEKDKFLIISLLISKYLSPSDIIVLNEYLPEIAKSILETNLED